ncbi:uncharacterized protein LOC127058349 [Gopherus flavomarginatus]|uniref:uncharacterized protein LOC127058349 n=1 Tax=Gopherus flavomarginatus TaxID=286002 RepID=UPI0021CBD412|nr:uncharacterized protein LOC127058349 [Gopherus flavomarginatus]
MGPLTNYKELLLFGLRHSAVRHNNWAKPYEIVQEPKESLVAFLQRIRDAIRQHITANPESPEIEAVIKGIFTSRAAPDIRRKLQKKEDLMGMTMAQILETANKAYSLRDVEKEKRQDAFFTIPVDTQSQEIFSFEWEDANRNKRQLCWTVLAQGFKNSPTLFGQALSRDLEGWENENKVLLLQYVRDSQPLLLDAPVHSLQPGDFVLVRTWKDKPLQEKWKGPYLVLLVSHTAAKVEGHKSWIHYSRLKAVPPPQNPNPKQWTVQPTGTETSEDLGLKLLFKRKSL